MLRMKDIKMKPKLIVLFLLAGLIPSLIVGWWSAKQATDALLQSSTNQLEAIRSIQQKQVENYFVLSVQRLESMIQESDISWMHSKLQRYHQDNIFVNYDKNDIRENIAFDVSTPEYAQIWEEEAGKLPNYVHEYGFYDVFIICAEYGNVMYTVAKEADLGTNLQHEPYKDSGLAKLWHRVVDKQTIIFQDFSPYAPSNNEPASFIGYPVKDINGDLIAVAALQISLDGINEVVQQREAWEKPAKYTWWDRTN